MAKIGTQVAFKKIGGWGGKRRGAGRPGKSGEISHGRRPRLDGSTPLHVTWRLRVASVNLRSGQVSSIFKSSALGAKKFGLRILHYSIQGNHLHLMVEASGNTELTAGLRSFMIRFAKGLRRHANWQGSLFAGRYHLHVLKTPTEVKRALVYVLQNFSKHSKRIWHLDEYSSAPHFGKWKALLNDNTGPLLAEYDGPKTLPVFLSAPRSWLAREGWLRSGH